MIDPVRLAVTAECLCTLAYEDRWTMRLFPVGDVRALAEAVPELLRENEELRRLALQSAVSVLKAAEETQGTNFLDEFIVLRNQLSRVEAERDEEAALRIILTRRMDEFQTIWRQAHPDHPEFFPDVASAFQAAVDKIRDLEIRLRYPAGWC